MAHWSDRYDWFARLDTLVDAEREEERAGDDWAIQAPAAVRWSRIRLAWARARGHRLVYLLGLVAILTVYTAIKAPYFGLPFTGWHPLKYNTSVEPAMYMAELNDPLHYEQRYRSSPTNPQGISSRFPNLPALEWGLYAAYEILPFSLEVSTRLFTHAVGLLTLVFAYLFFRYWLPKPLTLLVLFLVALSPIFAFATYVTVNDGITVLLTFVSLWALTRYLYGGGLRNLYWAGVVLGVATAVKYSAVLWLAPISLVLLAFRLSDRVRCVRDSILLLLLAAVPVLAMRTAVTRLPESPGTAAAALLGWLVVLALAHRFFSRESRPLDRLLLLLHERPGLVAALLGFSLAGAVLLYWALGLHRFNSRYLTDSQLIFEPGLYKFMLLSQFRRYATERVFWLAVAACPLIVLLRHGRAKELALAFGAGSIAYWIIASKAIFFHDYYTVIIMVTVSLGAALFIAFALSFGPILLRVALGAGLAALIVPGLVRETIDLVSRHEDISELVAYINQHTQPGDLILYEGYATATAIYTRRGLVRPQWLLDPETHKRVEEDGLGNALQEAGIRFLYTPDERPSYRDFVPLLTDTEISAPSFNRTYLICQRVGLNCPQIDASYAELDSLVKVFDIPAEFRLLDSAGRFRIFSFGDAGSHRRATDAIEPAGQGVPQRPNTAN